MSDYEDDFDDNSAYTKSTSTRRSSVASSSRNPPAAAAKAASISSSSSRSTRKSSFSSSKTASSRRPSSSSSSSSRSPASTRSSSRSNSAAKPSPSKAAGGLYNAHDDAHGTPQSPKSTSPTSANFVHQTRVTSVELLPEEKKPSYRAASTSSDVSDNDYRRGAGGEVADHVPSYRRKSSVRVPTPSSSSSTSSSSSSTMASKPASSVHSPRRQVTALTNGKTPVPDTYEYKPSAQPPAPAAGTSASSSAVVAQPPPAAGTSASLSSAVARPPAAGTSASSSSLVAQRAPAAGTSASSSSVVAPRAPAAGTSASSSSVVAPRAPAAGNSASSSSLISRPSAAEAAVSSSSAVAQPPLAAASVSSSELSSPVSLPVGTRSKPKNDSLQAKESSSSKRDPALVMISPNYNKPPIMKQRRASEQPLLQQHTPPPKPEAKKKEVLAASTAAKVKKEPKKVHEDKQPHEPPTPLPDVNRAVNRQRSATRRMPTVTSSAASPANVVRAELMKRARELHGEVNDWNEKIAYKERSIAMAAKLSNPDEHLEERTDEVRGENEALEAQYSRFEGQVINVAFLIAKMEDLLLRTQAKLKDLTDVKRAMEMRDKRAAHTIEGVHRRMPGRDELEQRQINEGMYSHQSLENKARQLRLNLQQTTSSIDHLTRKLRSVEAEASRKRLANASVKEIEALKELKIKNEKDIKQLNTVIVVYANAVYNHEKSSATSANTSVCTTPRRRGSGQTAVSDISVEMHKEADTLKQLRQYHSELDAHISEIQRDINKCEGKIRTNSVLLTKRSTSGALNAAGAGNSNSRMISANSFSKRSLENKLGIGASSLTSTPRNVGSSSSTSYTGAKRGGAGLGLPPVAKAGSAPPAQGRIPTHTPAKAAPQKAPVVPLPLLSLSSSPTYNAKKEVPTSSARPTSGQSVDSVDAVLQAIDKDTGGNMLAQRDSTATPGEMQGTLPGFSPADLKHTYPGVDDAPNRMVFANDEAEIGDALPVSVGASNINTSGAKEDNSKNNESDPVAYTPSSSPSIKNDDDDDVMSEVEAAAEEGDSGRDTPVWMR